MVASFLMELANRLGMNSNIEVIGFILLCAFTLISALYISTQLFETKKGKKGRSEKLVLCGSCGSGKTSFLYFLQLGFFPETVTSLEVTERACSLLNLGLNEEKTLKIVDFPGHARLRGDLNLLETTIASAKSIIFFIDSTDLGRSGNNLNDLSNLLYDIFVIIVKKNLNPSILFFCNKADLPNSISDVAEIEKLLLIQLTTIKNSRHTIEVEGTEEDEIMLGVKGRDFDILEDVGVQVEWVSGSVKENDLRGVASFLDKTF